MVDFGDTLFFLVTTPLFSILSYEALITFFLFALFFSLAAFFCSDVRGRTLVLFTGPNFYVSLFLTIEAVG